MADTSTAYRCESCEVLFLTTGEFLKHGCVKDLSDRAPAPNNCNETDFTKTMFQCRSCKGWFSETEEYESHPCKKAPVQSHSGATGTSSLTVTETLPSSSAPEAVRENEECCVCMNNAADCVLMDCGHLVTCMPCGKTLENCPMCRGNIKNRIKVYKC